MRCLYCSSFCILLRKRGWSGVTKLLELGWTENWIDSRFSGFLFAIVFLKMAVFRTGAGSSDMSVPFLSLSIF